MRLVYHDHFDCSDHCENYERLLHKRRRRAGYQSLLAAFLIGLNASGVAHVSIMAIIGSACWLWFWIRSYRAWRTVQHQIDEHAAHKNLYLPEATLR